VPHNFFDPGEPNEFDKQIAEHAAKTAAAEQQARDLDLRLAQVPGIPPGWLQERRRTGQLRNPWSTGNMTVQQALLAWPPARDLAQFLAAQAGQPLPAPGYEAQAREEQRRQWDEEMAEFVATSRQAREANPPQFDQKLYLGYAPGVQQDLAEGVRRRPSRKVI
jgi:hypothetical protein